MITASVFKKIKSLVSSGQVAAFGTHASGERVTINDSFKDYGFRSKAPAESKGIALFFGGQSDQGVLIKSVLDTEEVAEGDCEIYNQEGNSIKLFKKVLNIKTAEKIRIGTDSVELLENIETLAETLNDLIVAIDNATAGAMETGLASIKSKTGMQMLATKANEVKSSIESIREK